MQTEFKSFNEFKSKFENDTNFQEKIAENPLESIKSINIKSPWSSDKRIYRMVVFFLGIITLTICVGVLILIALDEINFNEIPEFFVSTVSLAIGAIAGILAPTPSTD